MIKTSLPPFSFEVTRYHEMLSRLRLRSLLAGTALVFVPGAVNAYQPSDDWIYQSLNEQCDVAVREAITENVRGSIESHVRRAEAAIRPPAPIGDLSCLDGLMSAPLDIFSNIGDISGSLIGGLGDLAGSIGDEIGSQICGFIETKWNELTEPMTDVIDITNDVSGYMSGDAFEFGEVFSLDAGESGYGGGFDGSTTEPPSNQPSENEFELDETGEYVSPIEDDVGEQIDEDAYEAAIQDYQLEEIQAFDAYMECMLDNYNWQFGGVANPNPNCEQILVDAQLSEPDIDDFIIGNPETNSTQTTSSLSSQSIQPGETDTGNDGNSTGPTSSSDDSAASEIWRQLGNQ